MTRSVDAGETFGLLGRNGAGKSTVIKMLTTLLPPSAGSARARLTKCVNERIECRARQAAYACGPRLPRSAEKTATTVRTKWRRNRRAQRSPGSVYTSVPAEVAAGRCVHASSSLSLAPIDAVRKPHLTAMPYPTNSDLPVGVRNHLPPHAQDIFRAAFNRAYADHALDPRREEAARRIAWAAVKRLYVRDGMYWVPR